MIQWIGFHGKIWKPETHGFLPWKIWVVFCKFSLKSYHVPIILGWQSQEPRLAMPSAKILRKSPRKLRPCCAGDRGPVRTPAVMATAMVFLGEKCGDWTKNGWWFRITVKFFCIENPVWFKKIRKDSPRKLLKFSLIPHLVAHPTARKWVSSPQL